MAGVPRGASVGGTIVRKARIGGFAVCGNHFERRGRSWLAIIRAAIWAIRFDLAQV